MNEENTKSPIKMLIYKEQALCRLRDFLIKSHVSVNRLWQSCRLSYPFVLGSASDDVRLPTAWDPLSIKALLGARILRPYQDTSVSQDTPLCGGSQFSEAPRIGRESKSRSSDARECCYQGRPRLKPYSFPDAKP